MGSNTEPVSTSLRTGLWEKVKRAAAERTNRAGKPMTFSAASWLVEAIDEKFAREDPEEDASDETT